MPLTWDNSLATGAAVVDEQHRRLFAEVEALATAMKQGKGREQIVAMFDFLGDYVVKHFRDEESLMERVNCPAAAKNKQAHAQFLAKFADLRKRLDTAGAGPALAMEAYNTICNWLVAHIKGIDLQLRDQMAGQKQGLVGAGK